MMTIQAQPHSQAPLLQFQEWLRHSFNRRVLNPVTLTFAGRRRSPYAMLRHVGRKSGQAHATPVFAVAADDRFYIPLPYGRQVDWCQNILASGTCTLVFQGQAIHTVEPVVVGVDEARPYFAPVIRWLIDTNAARTGHGDLLRLSRKDAGDANEYQAIVAQYPARPILRRAALVGGIALGLGLLVRRLIRSRAQVKEASQANESQ
jgi:deazaflavin-dependent oxidoreductase (nitroreductase family)